jgi:hypothetical protein
VAVGSGAYVTVTRPDIGAGCSERTEPTSRVTDGIWNTLTILKEGILTMNLGRLPLKILLFVAIITNKFILGQDIVGAYVASVGLGRQTLCFAEEEVWQ